MKRKIILLASCTLLLCGCSGVKTVNLTMDCEGKTTTGTVKKNDTLKCELTDKTYEFTITEISEDGSSITIKPNSPGLSDTNNLLDKKDTFNLKEGETLDLKTQTTDYRENVTFSYHLSK